MTAVAKWATPEKLADRSLAELERDYASVARQVGAMSPAPEQLLATRQAIYYEITARKISAGAPITSYPDAITNPLDPPAVDGTDVTGPA